MVINCVVYRHGQREENVDISDISEVLKEDNTFVWLGLYQPDAAFMQTLQQEFSLHELAIEDALVAHQRPKIEQYGESVFVVVKTAHLDAQQRISFGETHFFLGKNFLITVRHGSTDGYGGIRARAEKNQAMMSEGPAYAMYCILDCIVDNYSKITASLSQRISAMEDEMFSTRFHRDTLEEVYHLRRELLSLRNAAMPVTEICPQLVRFHEDLVPKNLRAYLRDVQDHAHHVMIDAEDMREMLTSAMQVNLALVSVQQSEVNKKLAGWGAVLIVPTIIFSMYGMNFADMPELHTHFGYPVALGVTLTICGFMWWRLKRSGWL
ncbi:MAG: magnesium/cobalt transporter CorA [Pantoea sp.]|uniref:Magnesium transport protein CorA n=1 Tax=Pantoea phytobeneficialis TaxID=2052056 RepID=A0AAP9HA83_9GAMM|nr:magnesium/cobalt transporter CorA [Pantoea phytobeneficialis]MDO6409017.1 magnesium/cobalt transporter CorA [Pantoea phytobeneficialis]QGR09379.1 magnesium and cobalt transport protein CorA [Pantoea phytobeneficialis]